MIDQFIYSNLTVLIRSSREDSINYLRINAQLDKPESVAFAAVDAFYCDVRDVESVPSIEEKQAAAALWNDNDCEIVGLIHGHPTITTSGCDTVASLCSYLKFNITSASVPRETAVPAALGVPYGNDRSQAAVNAFAHAYGDCKPFICEHCGRVYHDGGECTSDDCPGRESLISVFVGRRNTDVDYDTFLSVVEARPDASDVIADVSADYESSHGAGTWSDDGCFIVGVSAGALGVAWNPAGLDDADIAAVSRDVLGGAK